MKNNSPEQLQITQLDQMLWLTTPLGKFFKAIKQRPKKITSAPAKAKAYQTRSWVVRIPAAFTSYEHFLSVKTFFTEIIILLQFSFTKEYSFSLLLVGWLFFI